MVSCLLTLVAAAADSATQALDKMRVADGFTVDLVASEPEIRQPLSMTFDDRGRLWVVQYLQYPTPAGLKPVKVDQYLRTTYDRVPEPPPRGPRGADKITVCEDTDGDGRMDRFKDFVGGLNLCSGLALGYGGAFVVQSPYLLFYADRNGDDIPDGDPEVLLSGFGMEDSHAFANSLTWGPDGWLYGAQGSTVTANIRGIEFQQGIWRYHPVTRAFELFSEGGGNTWGLDFDEEGEVLAGTNFDDKMLHQVQGAYYVKNFGKHGALHNPFTYGFFEHVPYSGYRGKHISIGGVVYQSAAFPKGFFGTYIYGNTLDHAVYWAKRTKNGSTFTSSFGGTLLKTDDELFRPVDCTVGPDGAIYVADWCDKRATHVDPLDTWDRSNGRIYKVQWKGAIGKFSVPSDLTRLTTKELVALLGNDNDWLTRQARRLLAERRDRSVLPLLKKQVTNSDSSRVQLQSLWAYYTIDNRDFDDGFARQLLRHRNPAVVAWTVRLLCDDGKISSAVERAVVAVAETNASPLVVRQLACSAKRLAGKQALPVIEKLLLKDELTNDPFIPLLVWWALEDKAVSNRADIVRLFARGNVRNSSFVQEHILERLARRYSDEGTEEGLASCAELLQSGADESAAMATAVEKVLNGMDKSLAGKTVHSIPATLDRWFAAAWGRHPDEKRLLRLGLRLSRPYAEEAAMKLVTDEKAPGNQRVELIEILAQNAAPSLRETFLSLAAESSSKNVKIAALYGLRRFSDPEVANEILRLYPRFDAEVRFQANNVLVSRTTWALALVSMVEENGISAKDVSLDQVRKMASLKDDSLKSRLQKIWGRVDGESPAELENKINTLKLVLKPSGAAGRNATGNPLEGRKVFEQTCAACHKLFGEGGSIGPDLTNVERKDTALLLANIVNPSGYIRTEFMAHEVETKDDQVIVGVLVESTPNAVTVLDRNNQKYTLPREQVVEVREATASLMPEGLLDPLSPQQLIDLFSYLQRE